MFLNLLSAMVIILSSVTFAYGQQTNGNTMSQAICYEVINAPSNETKWTEAGLDTNIDWVLKCGDIVAYKLLWPTTGVWSDWYVTGVNDLITMASTEKIEKPKRMWSLFASHYHIFIICKSYQYKIQGDKC